MFALLLIQAHGDTNKNISSKRLIKHYVHKFGVYTLTTHTNGHMSLVSSLPL